MVTEIKDEWDCLSTEDQSHHFETPSRLLMLIPIYFYFRVSIQLLQLRHFNMLFAQFPKGAAIVQATKAAKRGNESRQGSL